jgi:aspartate kinase
MDLVKGRAVVKFGGADLSSGENIRKAAEMVVKSGYWEIAVVVSAMGKTTDDLIETMMQIGEVSDSEYADAVSMGERTSARLFASALRAQGAPATYLEPSMEGWPIITDSNYREAKPDMEETSTRVRRFLEPLLGKTIPVVCGFLGIDKAGSVTTLGRGGSDTTAVLLGNGLRAEEVILVKDTRGVMSADPKVVPDAKPLESLSIQEMLTLAQGGAKIVKAEALTYKLPEQKLRIVSFSMGLRSPGTEITGDLHSSSFEIRERQRLAAISLLSEINSENLSALFSRLKKPIYGVSTGAGSVTVFTSLEGAKEILKDLHGLGLFKAVSSRERVGMIELMHPVFINSPEWTAKLSGALASRNVNVIEITTNRSSINIFVDESQLDYAIKAVRDAIET